jgi:hypothetical protein
VAAAVSASESGEGVFTTACVGFRAYVASPIPRLVGMEVVEALRAALGQRSDVTVVRVKAIIHMAVKAVRSVEPGTSSKKHAANKPIGAVIAVRSTVIRGIVEISIGADGSDSDVYADSDLGLRRGCCAKEGGCENYQSKHINFEHNSSLGPFRV